MLSNFLVNILNKSLPDYIFFCIIRTFKKLDDYKMSLLDELKGEIWNAQEKAYKKRLKAERKEEQKDKQKTYFKQMKLF